MSHRSSPLTYLPTLLSLVGVVAVLVAQRVGSTSLQVASVGVAVLCAVAAGAVLGIGHVARMVQSEAGAPASGIDDGARDE